LTDTTSKGEEVVMEVIGGNRVPVKAWIDGVEFDEIARKQVANMASLPFVHSHIAIMPDVHAGIGATVGSVIPTVGAVVPAAVGVDIGCGVVAQRTTLRAEQLPDDLKPIRRAIERTVPVGFGMHKSVPASVESAWEPLLQRLSTIVAKYPKLDNDKGALQLGTLGSGNHFVSLPIDQDGFVWLMLHSGSRGIGNRIGQLFIERARNEMDRMGVTLRDRDLAYLTEDTMLFDDYIEAVGWAQDYARTSRDLMVRRILHAFRDPGLGLPSFQLAEAAVNCHHNYVVRERHFGSDVYVTRKGAVRAGAGELGIIPGSMGARSYVVRGKGNPDSFESCAHGAGRRMSRTDAKRRITLADLAEQTAGVECRKDAGVLDEAPAAYKDIDAVMFAQRDLVEVVYTLKEVVCVKG
jgi:tRNA-splicing ligase RtcB